MVEDKQERVELLETEKEYLEIRLETLTHELEEILPDMDRDDGWESTIRGKKTSVQRKLNRVESELAELKDEPASDYDQ